MHITLILSVLANVSRHLASRRSPIPCSRSPYVPTTGSRSTIVRPCIPVLAYLTPSAAGAIIFTVIALFSLLAYFGYRARIPLATLFLQVTLDVSKHHLSVYVVAFMALGIQAALSVWFTFTAIATCAYLSNNCAYLLTPVQLYQIYPRQSQYGFSCPLCPKLTRPSMFHRHTLLERHRGRPHLLRTIQLPLDVPGRWQRRACHPGRRALWRCACGYTRFRASALTNCVSAWYYFGPRSQGNMPAHPTLSAFGRASTLSLGSIAFGSLVVTILELIRLILNAARQNANAEGHRKIQPLPRVIVHACLI